MLLTESATARLALGALILYLVAHGLTGRQGLIAYVGLQERERALVAESARLGGQIDTLAERARRLRTGSPAFDRDYLEERARTLIDAARADELVFDLAVAPAGANAGLP